MRQIENIMIIDDDEVNNFICSRIIEKSKLTDNVQTFTGAREGLDYLQDVLKSSTEFPDLILLDLNMPVMTGWEFLDEYSTFADGAPKQAVLIVFSSSVYQEDIDRAEAYSVVSGYRYKPISLEVLNQIKDEFFSN